MSIDGTWNCTLNSSMGNQEVQMVLTSANGVVTGRLSAPIGEADVRDGKLNGDSARWKCSVTKPMSVTLAFDVKVSGDSISGSVKLGFFGKATLTGTRAQGITPA
jgi:hypothetical protein